MRLRRLVGPVGFDVIDEQEERPVRLQAFEKTPGAGFIYFHRKALKGGLYQRLKGLYSSFGLEVIREKDLEPIR